MPPRICTSCDEPHITSDWYPVYVHSRRLPGAVECVEAHEDRVRRETRDMHDNFTFTSERRYAQEET